MKSKAVSILIVLAVLMGIGFSSVVEAADKLEFAFAVNNASTFWMHGLAGTLKAEEQFGVDVEFYMTPGASVEEQKRFVETMVAKGVKGIALSVIDPAGATPFLNEVGEQVPVVLTDSDAPDSTRVAYVGMSNYAAGRMAGEKIREQLPEGGTFAVFVGKMDAQNAIERRQGIIDELSGKPYADQYPGEMTPNDPNLAIDKWTILDTRTDNADESRAKANVEDMLIKYPDIDLMTGLWSYNTPAIISALKDAGKLGEVKIVAFDEDETVLQAIKDGYVAGTIVQDPFEYGRKCIEVLYKLAVGEDAGIPENKLIDVPARYIVKDNVDAFWNTIKQQLDMAKNSMS